VYNGEHLYAMQSFIGCDKNGEDSPGLFLHSQRCSRLEESGVLGYTLSQVKKNSYAALIGAKSEDSTSSTFYLAYLRKPELEHDRSFDECRAMHPEEMALSSKTSPAPVVVGSSRRTGIASLKDLADSSPAVLDDISLYSDIAVIESIDDDMLVSGDISANNINILMHGSQKLMRLVVQLSSSASLSACGATALRIEEVLTGCSIS